MRDGRKGELLTLGTALTSCECLNEGIGFFVNFY